MSSTTEDLFASISKGHLPAIWEDEGTVNAGEVLRMLSFTEREVADAARVAPHTVKIGRRMPDAVLDRLREWAILLERVAGFFEGDVGKTVLWFNSPNPLLGGLTPREMIQFGRANKLSEIIKDALSGNLP